MKDFSNGQSKRKGEDKGSKNTKRKWTPKEDAVLIAALGELCNSGWKRENGIFKNGYTSALEAKLKTRIPNCSIKASPHIESRLKLLKRQYDAITEMQGSAGMQWDSKLNILSCEDDDVWEKWIQTHTDAKALRNKQFPYYNDLHLLFGNRGTRKGTNNDELDDDDDDDKVLDVDDDNGTGNLMVRDSLEEDELGDYEGSYGKEEEPKSDNNDNSSIERCKKRRIQRERSILPDQDAQSDDSARSYGENRWADASENQPHASNKVLNKKSCIREGGSSELEKLANIFSSFLDKYQHHLSLLTEIVGKEANAEKVAGEKRARLNGELKKLHNLNLQARLRAASLIVSDPAKLDLFYSLSKEERGEWVSMLLTGLI